MTLSYEASLEDFTEPAVRQYFHSSTAKSDRIRSAFVGAFLVGLAGYILARAAESTFTLIFVLIGAAVGAIAHYATHRGVATRRVQKYLRKQLDGRLPAKTVFSFEPGHFVCSCLDTTTKFPFLHLESLTEDEDYLEIYFGKIGLCTIPLRVFSSPSEKEQFIQAIRSEQCGPENPIPSGTSDAKASGVPDSRGL